MTMAELLSIGAPELPEGYYYRVRSNGWGYIFVAIRKERKWLDKTIHETMGLQDSYDEVGLPIKLSPKASISKAANAAHKHVFETRISTRTWWDEFREFEGDHK